MQALKILLTCILLGGMLDAQAAPGDPNPTSPPPCLPSLLTPAPGWNLKTKVNTTASYTKPSIAINGTSTIFIAWATEEKLETPAGSGNFLTFYKLNLTRYGTCVTHTSTSIERPSALVVLADDLGNVMVGYESNYGNRVVRYTPAGGWGLPQTISGVLRGMDAAGNAFAIAAHTSQENINLNSVYIQRFTPASGWGVSSKFVNWTTAGESFHFAVSRQGNAFFEWEDVDSGGSGAQRLVRRFSIASNSWEPAQVVSAYFRVPSLVATDDGVGWICGNRMFRIFSVVTEVPPPPATSGWTCDLRGLAMNSAGQRAVFTFDYDNFVTTESIRGTSGAWSGNTNLNGWYHSNSAIDSNGNVIALTATKNFRPQAHHCRTSNGSSFCTWSAPVQLDSSGIVPSNIWLRGWPNGNAVVMWYVDYESPTGINGNIYIRRYYK